MLSLIFYSLFKLNFLSTLLLLLRSHIHLECNLHFSLQLEETLLSIDSRILYAKSNKKGYTCICLYIPREF